jgi:hypothetical protein
MERDLVGALPSPIRARQGGGPAAKMIGGRPVAKRMKRIPVNPAAEAEVDVSDKHATKMRGFTDEEAITILSAALAPPNELTTAENAAAQPR